MKPFAAIIAIMPLIALAEVHAQSGTSASDDGWTVQLSFDNDLFAGTDQYYTNGIRLDLITPADELTQVGELARDTVGRLFADPAAGTWFTTFSINQEMYTPKDLTRRVPDPDDRPHAGFLHATIGIVSDDSTTLETVALDFGVIGRMAQADDAQRLIHDVITGDDPVGWPFQLRNEPGVRLIYERRNAYNDLFALPLGLTLDYGTGFAVSLGNVDTSVSGGATLRLSSSTTQRYGPPRLHPRVIGPTLWPVSGFDWYAFVGFEGRFVGRNIFLEGSTFRNSPSVEPHRLIADLQTGIALKYEGIMLSYAHVIRSPEFRGQRGFSQFGRLALAVNF